ncbi:MAG: cupin domain-containing protein [SAR202 cluster bacterium]|nr:cupin domain-containing protein [SAR202 cluster bacterium]
MPIIDHHQAPEVPWRPGYRKWDIAGAAQGVTSTFNISTARTGAGAPIHTHNVDEIIVVMEGALEVSIAGETYTVGKDHTVVVPPGVAHGFKIVSAQDARIMVFFPALDPYSEKHTHYMEGSRPPSVKA